MKVTLLFLVMLCIGFGCTETGVNPQIKTSVTSNQTNVSFSVENRSYSNIYFSRAEDRIGFWVLERKENNTWINASKDSVFGEVIYSNEDQILHPGKSFNDSVLIYHAGRYRFKIPFVRDENGTEMDSVFTKEFVVE